MARETTPRVDSVALPPLVEKAHQALRKAVAGVILEHRRTGRPLVVSQDGRVGYVDSWPVPLPDGEEQPR